MGIANIINNSTTTSGGEIVRELVNSSDGAGLNLANNGYIDVANNAATEFSTTDFSIEFVLNQTADNVSDNYIYFSHIGGNSRLVMWNDISANTIVARFTDSGGSNTDVTLSYDMSQDYGTPTHYVFAFDRSADLTLYKNGNSVASASISAASSINIGAGNANVSRIGSGTNYGALGTFYRFRAFSTLADAKLLSERADVPRTLTANLLCDLDLAFANPTQSLTVQDRKGNSDGTASSNTLVTQVQPVVQLNSTSARIGTTAATPADGDVLISGNVGIGESSPAKTLHVVGSSRLESTIDPTMQLKRSGNTAGNGSIECLGSDDSVDYAITFAGTTAGAMQFSTAAVDALTIDASGKTTANALKVLDPTHGRYFDFVLDSSASYLDVSHALNLRVNGASSLATAMTISSTGATTLTASSQNVLHVNRTTSDGDCLLVEAGGSAKMRFGTLGITFPNGGYAPAAAANNQLDYYGEGTWTPSVGGDATYSVQNGRYTRVGRLVTATWDMTISVIGTGSTYIVSGLPFNSADSIGAGGSIIYYSSLATSPVLFAPTVGGGTVHIRSATSAATSPSNHSILGNGSRIAGIVTYTV